MAPVTSGKTDEAIRTLETAFNKGVAPGAPVRGQSWLCLRAGRPPRGGGENCRRKFVQPIQPGPDLRVYGRQGPYVRSSGSRRRRWTFSDRPGNQQPGILTASGRSAVESSSQEGRLAGIIFHTSTGKPTSFPLLDKVPLSARSARVRRLADNLFMSSCGRIDSLDVM